MLHNRALSELWHIFHSSLNACYVTQIIMVHSLGTMRLIYKCMLLTSHFTYYGALDDRTILTAKQYTALNGSLFDLKEIGTKHHESDGDVWLCLTA